MIPKKFLIKDYIDKELSNKEIIFLLKEIKEKKSMDAIKKIISHKHNTIQNYTKRYFIPGEDKDVIMQLCFIGIYKGALTFNPKKNNNPSSFLSLVMERQIKTAITHEHRQLRYETNHMSCSLDKPFYSNKDGDEVSLKDILPDEKTIHPELGYINKETIEFLEKYTSQALTPLEYKCMRLYLNDNSYVKIAKKLNTHYKSVDNAIQRAKKKLGKGVKEKEILAC